MACIVAMPMECELVTEFFPASFTFRGNMIDLNKISFVELQFTPTTFPGLLLQEFRFGLVHHGMHFEPLTPIQQVSVVGASCSSYLPVSPDFGRAVHTEFRLFWG